jgi:hypothetical protein
MTLIFRLMSAWAVAAGAFVLSGLLTLGFAASAAAEEVCAPKAEEALVRAVAYHRRIGLAGAAAKLLEDKALARARWCPNENDDDACAALFAKGAQDYVNRLPGTAAILYARDDASVCAFLFSPGEKMVYGRTAIRSAVFDTTAEGLRARMAMELETGPAAAKRALSTRRLTSLRSGICDPSEADRPDATRALQVEARAAASTPAAEAAIAAALFPKALQDGLAKAKHLSIIPFGPISAMPLAALKPFGDERQTADLFTINFLLFAGEVLRPPSAWTGAPAAPLIFGNPKPKDRVRAQCVTPLPFAEKEATFVKSILGGTYLAGESATRQAFEERAKDADALYFAAHGLAGLEDGIDDSFIALADQNLTARDVQRVSGFGFKTRLVVMSACQTGLGRIDEFGVIGLARTFLDAGAENTVMTLWNVDDASTAALMETFSRNLAVHQPAEALAIAQRAVKANPATAAPFHWAGFAVYGNQLAPVSRSD